MLCSERRLSTRLSAAPRAFVAVADAAGDASNKIVLHVTGVHRGTASGYDALQPQQMSALSDQASNALLGQMVGMLQKRTEYRSIRTWPSKRSSGTRKAAGGRRGMAAHG